MAPSLGGIDHVHVFVRDRAAAQRWYAEVLGFTAVDGAEAAASDGGPLTIANTSRRIHLALFQRSPGGSPSTVAMDTTAREFLVWRRHLAERLGRPVDAVDHRTSWSLYFSDPDGNPYEIITYEYDALPSASE